MTDRLAMLGQFASVSTDPNVVDSLSPALLRGARETAHNIAVQLADGGDLTLQGVWGVIVGAHLQAATGSSNLSLAFLERLAQASSGAETPAGPNPIVLITCSFLAAEFLSGPLVDS